MKAIPWKNKYALFTLIFLIGLGISLIITFTNPALICGEEKGCDLVLQSKYNVNYNYNAIIFPFQSKKKNNLSRN